MPKEALVRKRAIPDDEEDDFRQRALLNKKEKQEGGLFKLPEGPTTFRILKTPADKQRGTPSVWMEYYVHRNVGPKKVGPLRCGVEVDSDEGSCWLCSAVEKLRDNGKALVASELERKKAFAIQVAVWSDEINDLRGPLLWVTSSGKTAKALSYKLITIVSAPATKRYVDHEDGYNFSIDRTGTGMTDTTYTAPERAEDRTSVPNGIIAKLKPFSEVLPSYDKEAQKRAYYGETAGSVREEEDSPRRRKPVEDEDEDERPKRNARNLDEEDETDSIDSEPELDDEEDVDDEPKVRARKPKPSEDDDEDLEFGEDEDSPEPDEDDEELETKKPKKAAKKVKAEEDEDEGEASDEEEEEVKPVRKRR